MPLPLCLSCCGLRVIVRTQLIIHILCRPPPCCMRVIRLQAGARPKKIGGLTLRLIGEDETGLSRLFDKGLMCDLTTVHTHTHSVTLARDILFTRALVGIVISKLALTSCNPPPPTAEHINARLAAPAAQPAPEISVVSS